MHWNGAVICVRASWREAQNHPSNYAGYAIAKHNINEMQTERLETSTEMVLPITPVWNNALQ
jgi:hypothetical protein